MLRWPGSAKRIVSVIRHVACSGVLDVTAALLPENAVPLVLRNHVQGFYFYFHSSLDTTAPVGGGIQNI